MKSLYFLLALVSVSAAAAVSDKIYTYDTISKLGPECFNAIKTGSNPDEVFQTQEF